MYIKRLPWCVCVCIKLLPWCVCIKLLLVVIVFVCLFLARAFFPAGYNYFGNERLYSGIDGREFEADIFMGVVYYQRLRHMVYDKFQVRTTGPIDILTHQPVKGRKKAGGIRFGEMERDSLIAHGSSFLLQDRLLNCSDKSYVRELVIVCVCLKFSYCKGVLQTYYKSIPLIKEGIT